MNNKQHDTLSDRQVVVLMIIGAVAGTLIIPVIILILSAFGL